MPDSVRLKGLGHRIPPHHATALPPGLGRIPPLVVKGTITARRRALDQQ
jgi:hypothetical protein